MNPAETQVRRATVDDLPQLLALWTGMRYAAEELERRLTDFQVAVTADGVLLGALALEMIGGQGRLHSEAFGDFSLADDLRGRFWERFQIIAANHALTRLWTQENAPLCKRLGFAPPDAEAAAKFPAAWRPLGPDWLTLGLRAEEAFDPRVEAGFQQLKAEARARAENAQRRAVLIQQVATGLAVIIALGIIVASVYLWAHRNRLPTP